MFFKWTPWGVYLFADFVEFYWFEFNSLTKMSYTPSGMWFCRGFW